MALDIHIGLTLGSRTTFVACGTRALSGFPSSTSDANRAWLSEVCFAHALVRWVQLLCCTGLLAAAEPKALRWTLWHSPAGVVRKAGRWIVRMLDGWPTCR